MEFFKFSVYVLKSFMILKSNSVYYLHNTGNNGRKLFYLPKNYDFFTQKMKKAISPFAQIIDFVLEENAFHILIETRKDIPKNMLNHNIGIMLRSYAQAINKQEKFFGSLFRQRTKAYSRMSYIPSSKRVIINKFAVQLENSDLVDFKKTIRKYMKSIGKKEESEQVHNSENKTTQSPKNKNKIMTTSKIFTKGLGPENSDSLPINKPDLQSWQKQNEFTPP